MLDDAYRDADPADLIGVRFIHPSLRCKYYDLPFKAKMEYTPERILATLQKLIQSGEDLEIDSEWQLVFTTVRATRGGRPAERKWNHRKWMEKHCGHGGCFIKIENPGDELCLARAIVVGKARIDKETDPQVARDWDNIQRGGRRTLQKRMAQDLMTRAGLEEHRGKFA